jgi:hypothetical protein
LELTQDRQADDQEDAAPLPAGQDLLKLIFDLRDRLIRQQQTVQRVQSQLTSRPSLLARLTGDSHMKRAAESVQGLRESVDMMSDRVDAALDGWGIEVIGQVGEAFDPQTMTTVEVVWSPDAEDGVVLEVYKSGYELYGQVLAMAQVKVSRRKPA